jgi:AcrR family transcriptional regulator
MNSASDHLRPYSSPARTEQARATRERILDAALALFQDKGLDLTAISDIAALADVSSSTIYGLFKSKDGLLRGLMERALFGSPFKAAQAMLETETDAVRLITLTADVAAAIYDSERAELGLLRQVAGFSPTLKRMEQEFEELRFAMQEPRIAALFEAKRAKPGLTPEEARRILWMYTSREIFRMLVREGGWTVERYRVWLSQTLTDALVAPLA